MFILTYVTKALEIKQNTIDFNDNYKCKMLHSCIILITKKNALNVVTYKPSRENKAVLFH